MTKQQILYELTKPNYKNCARKMLTFSHGMVNLINSHCYSTRKNFSEFTREALLEKYTRETASTNQTIIKL